MTRTRPVVAIDGPAGAGKTTVTRRLAEELGYLRLDTGALYRCVAYGCRQEGVGFDDAESAGAVARRLVADEAIELTLAPSGQRISLRGDDVTTAIRSNEMSQGASKVSAHPPVREALLELQRQLGREGGVVVEGRDIGTVVFPDAEIKFFLTASVRVRAQRRHAELEKRGDSTPIAMVEQEVRERDERDMRRPVAPLVQASDAELVDSSTQSIDDVVASLVQRVRVVEAQLGAH